MSRTYRRFDAEGRNDVDRWLNYWNWGGDTQEERYRYAVKFHSDGYGSDGRAKGLREETRRIARADQREQLHRIMKCTDYEDVYYDSSHENHQAKYLIWVYY